MRISSGFRNRLLRFTDHLQCLLQNQVIKRPMVKAYKKVDAPL